MALHRQIQDLERQGQGAMEKDVQENTAVNELQKETFERESLFFAEAHYVEIVALRKICLFQKKKSTFAA